VKTAKAELQRRTAAAAEQDRRRAEMEAKIAQGRVELIEWEEAGVRTLMGETLPDDCLVAAPPFSPAMQFLMDKIRGVSVEQFERAVNQAVIDLLLSGGVPLDNSTRRFIAAGYWRLAYPQEAKKDALRAKLKAVEGAREVLKGRGWSLADADDELAQNFGHNSGKALRRWMRRARSS
jgi:hypothetical protein